MNLSEKLAAADGGADAASDTAASAPAGGPPRNRRAGDPGGPPARSNPFGSPGSKGHPMRRASDRAALDQAWKTSKQKVQAKVLAEIGPSAADLSSDELRDKVRSTVNEIFDREDLGISPIERQRFVEEILEDSLGYGPLEALLADNSITEVMCNAYDEIWIERKGRIERSDIEFTSNDQYRRIIDRMVHAVGRRVDEASPMVDARLADGSRINAIVPPLALRGPVLTIRKFPERAFLMQDLINLGSLTMDAAVFLEACVRGKISTIVVGGTGTGKTTMLNVLSNFIPDGERLITIEESAELQIQGAHVVTLETRPANAEGTGEVRIRDLVRNSLRMRPDRIIVGEIRGEEALELLHAINMGHDGSLMTIQANTPAEALTRFETFAQTGGADLPTKVLRERLTSAVDVVIQLSRLRDGSRKLTSVCEVAGMEGDQVMVTELFKFLEEGRNAQGKVTGQLRATGRRPVFAGRLEEAGYRMPTVIGMSALDFRPPPSSSP